MVLSFLHVLYEIFLPIQQIPKGKNTVNTVYKQTLRKLQTNLAKAWSKSSIHKSSSKKLYIKGCHLTSITPKMFFGVVWKKWLFRMKIFLRTFKNSDNHSRVILCHIIMPHYYTAILIIKIKILRKLILSQSYISYIKLFFHLTIYKKKKEFTDGLLMIILK